MSNLLDAPIKHLLESLYLMGIGDENGCRVNIPIQDLIDILAEGGITVNVELESEGSGVDIYNGVNSTNNKPKIARVNCEDGTINISKKQDGTLLISANMPTINYPVINGNSVGDSEGVSVFKELRDKILDFKKIKGLGSVIIKDNNETIEVYLASEGSVVDDNWYINENYVRSSDWSNKPSTETYTYNGNIYGLRDSNGNIIPAGTVFKLPTGKASDPFISYEEFLVKFIKSGTRSMPANGDRKVVLQSKINTTSDVEVNTAVLDFRGISFVHKYRPGHSGYVESYYPIDFRRLYNEMPKKPNGKLSSSIRFNINGYGLFSRDYGFGLLYVKSDLVATSDGESCMMEMNFTELGVSFIEATNWVSSDDISGTGMYNIIKNPDGSPLRHGNSVVRGSKTQPKYPLIVIDGNTSGYWALFITGTRIRVETKTQKGIHCVNGGRAVFQTAQNEFQVNNYFVGYKHAIYKEGGVYKTDDGLTPTADEIQCAEDRGGFLLYPYPSYNVIEMDYNAGSNSILRIASITSEPDGAPFCASNAFLKMNGGAVFLNSQQIKEEGGLHGLNFIETTGENTIELAQGRAYGYFDNFLKDDGVNTTTITLYGSILSNVRYIKVPNKMEISSPIMSVISGKTLLTVQDSQYGLVYPMLYRNGGDINVKI